MRYIRYLFFFGACLLCAGLQADIIFQDSFNYADGELPFPWSRHSGIGGQTIVNGELFLDDDFTGDYNREFEAITSGWVFAGFDLRVSSFDLPSSEDGQYFAHFGDVTSGSARFVSRLYLASAPSGYRIGISRGFDGSRPFLAETFLPDRTYRVVHGFHMESYTAVLAVDSPDGSNSIMASDGITDPNFLRFFAFRNLNGTDGDKFVDNLSVATTYSSAFSAVPEPNTSLVVATMAGIGIAKARRRRPVLDLRIAYR
jgi:hypothetical protein